jgi:hypothetical protein
MPKRSDRYPKLLAQIQNKGDFDEKALWLMILKNVM